MQLVWAMRNGDLTLVQDQVREILARRPRHVVISCEALSRLDLAQIGQLRRLLGAAPAQIVYYVRRWPERLPSLWQETVKFGHTDTLPEFLAKHLTGTDDSELSDASVIDRFSAIFGAPQVKVVSYSHLIEQSLDIAAHFLASFLGLPDIALPGPGRPNQSLPILDTELIRILNAIHVRRGGERSPALREWYLAHKEGLVPDAILDLARKCLNTIRLMKPQSRLSSRPRKSTPAMLRPSFRLGAWAHCMSFARLMCPMCGKTIYWNRPQRRSWVIFMTSAHAVAEMHYRGSRENRFRKSLIASNSTCGSPSQAKRGGTR
jgi:hypothetical protein